MSREIVSVIVVNRNTRDYLRTCLCSLLEQDFDGELEIIVVDNNSSDGSPEMVLGDFPEASLVWGVKNEGYAKACNQGFSISRGDYLIFMNSDVVLGKESVSGIIEVFGRRKDAGAAGPSVLNPDGTTQYSCREFPDIKTAFFHAFLGLLKPENPYTKKYRKMECDHETEMEVDWVSGAFIAFKRKAFDDVGGFDEDYHMYVEDVDICWRLREAGWKVYFTPKSLITHHIGKSSEVVPVRMLYHHHRSMFRFHRKTYDGPLKPFVSLLVFMGICLRFTLLVFLNILFRIRKSHMRSKKGDYPGKAVT
ncbi:MAG: glycosyltransferase family 2 protein [Actinomycetota bacterium]|nr:glycosyltransferase family 2 protein [Actinomycetota bacterium]